MRFAIFPYVRGVILVELTARISPISINSDLNGPSWTVTTISPGMMARLLNFKPITNSTTKPIPINTHRFLFVIPIVSTVSINRVIFMLRRDRLI